MTLYIQKHNKKQKKSGYTLIELLVYIAVLGLMLSVIMGTVVGMSKIYRKIRVAEVLETSVNSAYEVMVREVRDAISVDIGSSTLGDDNSVLALNSTDNLGASKTVSFYLLGGRIYINENSAVVGPLTSQDATVTALRFDHIDATNSEAVKMYITISVGTGSYVKTETFYDTVVLRSSYEF